MDLLFLHTPKFHNYYKPIGEFSFVLFPPMGLLGLADYLVRNGHTTRIVHLGVEQHLNGPLDFDKIIAEHRPAIVGLDLHWHFQSYDVIEVARRIKESHPEIAILLGGFTASIFAEEILRDHPFVDFVIRGDAEVPILELVHRHSSDQNYADVPNLVHRENAVVRSNAQSYVADSAMLDSMCFTDFTLMKDYPTFVRGFSRYVHLDGYSEASQRRVFGDHANFPVMIGRGCAYDCSFCGGCHKAHELIAGRTEIALRSANSVVASLGDLERFGFDSAGLCHDCCQPDEADDYYISIFEQLKKNGNRLNIHVERYFLPSIRFLESFSLLPSKQGSIALSVHSHDEQLRRRNGFHRYSNAALEDSLTRMNALGIRTVLFFDCGLPFETMEDLEAMVDYQQYLRKKFRQVAIRTAIIEIEPGSPISRKPLDYDLKPERTTFADFYHYHSQPMKNHFQETGYVRCDLPDQNELTEFFCRNFCEKIHAGAASPYVCTSIELVRKMGAFKVLDGLSLLNKHNTEKSV